MISKQSISYINLHTASFVQLPQQHGWYLSIYNLYIVSHVAPLCELIDSLWNAHVGVVKMQPSTCLLIFTYEYLSKFVAEIQFIS
jgi:hypothetical protein